MPPNTSARRRRDDRCHAHRDADENAAPNEPCDATCFFELVQALAIALEFNHNIGRGGRGGKQRLQGLAISCIFLSFYDADPPFSIHPLMRGRDRDPVARGPDLINSALQRWVFSLELCA